VSRRGFGWTRRTVQWLVGAPAALAGAVFLIWLIGLPIAHLFFRGAAHLWSRSVWDSFIRRDFFPGWNVLAHGTGWFWLFATIWLGVATVMAVSDSGYHRSAAGRGVICATLVLLTVFGGVWTVVAIANNDKDLGAYYNASVRFVVPNPHRVPSQLRLLVTDSGTHTGSGTCRYVRTGDVPACVTAGTLPTDWVARNSSAEAAANKLEKASVGGSNTYVMGDSLTYLYQGDGRWSAIRDGKNRQPLDAVVEWNGAGATTECRFEGRYAIKGSFQGSWSQNLPSAIVKRFPGLYFDLGDVWGYCKGREPVVVLPVTRQVAYHNRMVMTSAGVLTITGDHGHAHLVHTADVRAGDLPGPAYPTSLTEAARDDSRWAAGRASMSRSSFGFKPTTATSQYGNVSEYLLQNPTTHRLYWVTPLTPRGSDSQQFVAWAITPADYTDDGRLNTTKIYVLPDNSPKIINLIDLEARAKQALSATNPGFFSAGGRIVEFLPVNAGKWQAYGELNNRVNYRLDIPTSSQAQTQVFDLSAGSTSTSGPPGTGVCGKDPTMLTDDQLALCIKEFGDELARRAGGK
jgi:hypothetical protein